MGKFLLGMVTGVFVGAFTMEMLNKKRPDLVRLIEEKAEKSSSSVLAFLKEVHAEGPEMAFFDEPMAPPARRKAAQPREEIIQWP